MAQSKESHTHYCRDWQRQKKEQLAGRPCPNRCEVCGAKPKPDHKLHFDHDHSTAEFRGWLCSNCNIAIGQCHDNPLHLEALADYLRNQA